jgi:hypothetical protein
MDPDDLALIQQYLGRPGPQDTLQSQPQDPSQALADAVQQFSIAQGLGPLASHASPEELQRSQDLAEGIRQHALQNSLPSQPIDPAFNRMYAHPLPSSASAPSAPPLAPAYQPAPQRLAPSPTLQDAAAHELLIRGVNPNADYSPSENDALVNLARGRAAPSWDPAPSLTEPNGALARGVPPLPGHVGPNGYVPAPEDEHLLARIMFAEGSDTPQDYPGLAWGTVNRVGGREFGNTLRQVIDQKNGFQSVEKGGGPKGGSRQWRLTEDPSKLTGSNLESWRQAEQVAHDVLSGAIPDPTGGAQYYFSSRDVDGDAAKASWGWFRDKITHGGFRSSPYLGHIGVDKDGPHRNYFLIETPQTPMVER